MNTNYNKNARALIRSMENTYLVHQIGMQYLYLNICSVSFPSRQQSTPTDITVGDLCMQVFTLNTERLRPLETQGLIFNLCGTLDVLFQDNKVILYIVWSQRLTFIF